MAKLIRSAKWGLLGIALALCGCEGLRNGAPPLIHIRNGSLVVPQNGPDAGRSPQSDYHLKAIVDAIRSDCLTVEPTPTITDNRRNRLVSAYMFAVDLNYRDYERNLLNSTRENDLGAAAASLGLSSIGSVVGDQNIARALSTANSIITGTHTAIGRDYLMNQTLTVLQTQMRANRNTQRALIIRRMRLALTDWDSCMALSDALVYEQAGTLNGALAAIAADAAEANREGERILATAVESCVAEASAVVFAGRIRRYVEGLARPDPAPTHDTRIANLRKVAEAMGLSEEERQKAPDALLERIKEVLSTGTGGRCSAADLEALISRIQQATGEPVA